MRTYIILAILVVCSVVTATSSYVYASDTYRLKQWIAPLECTKNEIIDGVNTTTYLTPEECDDLLHPTPTPTPTPKPIDDETTPTVIPKAPNTGYAEPLITGFLVIGVMVLLGVLRLAKDHNEQR